MTKMADVYTREELEEAYPLGAVYNQTDDELVPLTPEEWAAWIDGQVGMEKHPVAAVEPEA